MGVLGEFLIIASAGAAGVLLSAIPGFPLPGTVAGMIIMFILLVCGAVKIKQIEKTAGFFLKFLPLFFIPVIVNLLNEKETFQTYGFKLILIIIITTLITLTATGLTAKLMLHILEKRNSR